MISVAYVMVILQGHYSLKKGVALLGIGIDNIYSVKADSKGKMDPVALENKILQLQSEASTTEVL